MMTPEVAKRFLFDQLAEELATLLPVPGQLPAWLAVKIDNLTKNFPSQEVVSLATAFCRLRFPLLEEVPTCDWKNVTDCLVGQALIINAERETLANINVFFQDKIVPDFIVVTNYDDDGSVYFDQISYNLQEDRDITRTAIEKLFQELGKDFEPLAPIHFTQGGFDRLVADHHLFEEAARQKFSNRNDPKYVEQVCYNACRHWKYDRKLVDGGMVVEWVNQFKQAGFVQEACEILNYLRQYGFLTVNRVAENIASCYDTLEKTLGKRPIMLTLQDVGKSESELARQVKKLTKTGRLLPLEEAIDRVNRASPNNYPIHLVCFDDFIGSGETMRKHLLVKTKNPLAKNSFADDLIKCFVEKKARLTVLVSHADEKGINALYNDPRGHGAITVMAIRTINDKCRAFHPDSPIFLDKSRITAFKKYCKKIGKKIHSKGPLGWNDAQWCIVTEYNVPDCSLPILWASGKRDFPWVPLFPRKRNAS